MNQFLLHQMPHLLDTLAEQGWVALKQALSPESCKGLRDNLELRFAAGDFTQAGVGKGGARREEQRIRSDQIHWLRAQDPSPAVIAWVEDVIDLVASLNLNLFLSINSYDCHYACYPPGTFYQKHLDRFRTDSGRLISIILFLNDDWLQKEDGELLIYDALDSQRVIAEIQPESGTLVLFQSDRVLHEVRRTNRRRLSLTGWLQSLPAVDASLGQNLIRKM